MGAVERTTLTTGANTGIGLATAIELARIDAEENLVVDLALNAAPTTAAAMEPAL